MSDVAGPAGVHVVRRGRGRLLVVLVDAAWKAVQTVTSPHVEIAEGTPFRRYRIGPAAKARALDRRTSFGTTTRYA